MMLRALLAALVLGAVAPALAQTAAPPSPVPASADALVCPVSIFSVVPLETSSPEGARKYAFAIQAFQPDAGHVAGTLTVFTNDQRFDIPFKDAVAAGFGWNTLEHVEPPAWRFLSR
jgi:hypothetical protein